MSTLVFRFEKLNFLFSFLFIAKKEEKLAKYMEWGKGLVQKKQREEKLKNDLYEVEKPLARYKNDKDLEQILKDQEREGNKTIINYFLS